MLWNFYFIGQDYTAMRKLVSFAFSLVVSNVLGLSPKPPLKFWIRLWRHVLPWNVNISWHLMCCKCKALDYAFALKCTPLATRPWTWFRLWIFVWRLQSRFLCKLLLVWESNSCSNSFPGSYLFLTFMACTTFQRDASFVLFWVGKSQASQFSLCSSLTVCSE